MKKVVIAGGTGYVGRHLTPHLSKQGYECLVLSTREESATEPRIVKWDGKTGGPWQQELEGAYGVINLCGAPISLHWNEANKLAILESRIDSTRILGETIAACQAPPAVWINASAIGYYGNRGTEILTESSVPGKKGDFLVDTCVAWEYEHERAPAPNTRKVRVRTGVVLGKGAAAFKPLYQVTKFYLGGHLGDGRQYMSWIHIEDLTAIYLWALENEVSRSLNATAPEPVTNEFLMATLRAVMSRPWAPPVPAFMLKLVTLFGGPEASLLLDSQRSVPQTLEREQFSFRFGNVRDAIAQIVASV